MNLHVEYEAEVLITLGLTGVPDCDGLILKHGSPDEVLGVRNGGNPLASEWLADLTGPGNHLVCYSGTLAGELFEAHPTTWLTPGHEALAKLCEGAREALQRSGKSICFHPHRRHVLSDATSCRAFLKEHEGQPYEIALVPGEMFEPSMAEDVDDHLTRIFQTLGGTCAMAILRDFVIDEDGEEGPTCRPAPLGEGLLPREHVRQLIADCLPEETPVVIASTDLEGQMDWLLG